MERSIRPAVCFLCAAMIGIGSPNDSGLLAGDSALGSAPKKKSGRKKGRKKTRKKQPRSKVDMSAVPADEDAEAKIQEELGETFTLLRTRHYSIFYDTAEDDVKMFGGAVERTYRSCVRYTTKLGIDAKPPKKKLISYFFNEFDAYAEFSKSLGGPAPTPNLLGFYLPSTNNTYFYNFRNTPTFKKLRLDAEAKLKKLGEEARRGNLNANRRRQLDLRMREARWILNRTDGLGGGQTEETLQHEVAHQVLFNIGFHSGKNLRNPFINPRWFVEGTAQIFEPISDGKAANFGQLNKNALQAYQFIEQNGHCIPLRDFIVEMRYFFRGDAGNLAYPQSWAIVYYLNKTKRKKMVKYIETILNRPEDYETSAEQEIEDFEAAFGKLDKKWERRWRAWMKNVR